MRILHLVAGQKWTGTAAVVFDQTAALVGGGIEAQFAFVGDSPLAERLHPLGWARPLLTPTRTPVDLIRDLSSVASTIRREPFDVLHAHGTHDHHVAALAVRGTRIRVARTVHNLRHVRRDPITRALHGRTPAFAFANSEIARAFGAGGPVHSPVIDTVLFSPPAEGSPDADRDAFLVGTIGKMAEGRGHREAVAAGAAARGVTLVHVGHGELQTGLQALAAKEGAADRNRWLGYRERDLPEIYRSWDAFLFAASGSEQGQRAILEAMASGLPVVALEVPGVHDLMTDGREGFIVGGTEGLAPALMRLASDSDLRRQMGKAARARALAFTAERYVEKALDFYGRLLAAESPV